MEVITKGEAPSGRFWRLTILHYIMKTSASSLLQYLWYKKVYGTQNRREGGSRVAWGHYAVREVREGCSDKVTLTN